MRRTVAISAATMLAVSGMGIAAASSASTVSGSGQRRAVAEAKSLLATAPTLAGAVRSSGAPMKILAEAPQRAAYDQLVQRAKFWTVGESWKQAYADLTATTPSRLSADGTGRDGGPKRGDNAVYATYTTDKLPARIAYAELLVAVSPMGHGKAAIGVYGQAVPQPARLSRETVPASLRHVHVAVRTPAGHIVRTNTVTGPTAKRVVRDFDALLVAPPGERSCPADLGRRELVTFHADGHTLLATAGFCGFVDVSVDGHQLPPLETSGAFGNDISHDLAPAPAAKSHHRPKRPAAEHVPLSLRRVHMVRRNKPFGANTKRRTVTGKRAARLVHSFDAMRTEPIHSVHCDIAGSPQVIVTFHATKHTWVVKESACTNIVVTRDGTSLPTLLSNKTWEKAVASALRH